MHIQTIFHHPSAVLVATTRTVASSAGPVVMVGLPGAAAAHDLRIVSATHRAAWTPPGLFSTILLVLYEYSKRGKLQIQAGIHLLIFIRTSSRDGSSYELAVFFLCRAA